MSLYIIEDRYGALRDSSVNYNYAKSLQQSKYPDGHIVEMVPAKPKVQVSQEEAEFIDSVTNDTGFNPAGLIDHYVVEHFDECKDWPAEEFRLMEAVSDGYTVFEPKKYNVKVPYANYKWYLKTPDGKLDTIWVKGLAKGFGGYPDGIELTNDDIENFGLQDCEKEAVTDDDD